MKTLQIFISSPGDVFEERAIANRVIERLQSEYIGRLVLEPVLWEHEPLLATSTFQQQIVKPSETDVMIAILWSRLGTKLPKDFTRPDGSRYNSGTEYEFEEAIAGFRKSGKPDMLVYRKMAPPSVRLDDEKELMDRLAQKKKLDEFVDRWFHDKAEGTLKAAFHAFDSPSDFETLLENHLHKLIERRLPRSHSATTEARAVWKKGSPFRGLATFDFEHAPVFFGRTKAVSDILQALREQAADDRSFVVILGMSGGGKSSLARAGVLPMLTRPGVIFLQTQDPELGWIRNVMRIAGTRCDVRPNTDPAGLNFVLKEWIGDAGGGQLGYFGKKAAERIARNRNTERLGTFSLLVSVGVVVVFVVGGAVVPERWFDPLMVLMGVTLLMYGIRQGYAYATAEKDLIKQYEFMLRIFSNAHRRLESAKDPDEQRQILRALGGSALDEHAEWILMHRERSIDEGEIWRMSS